MNKSISSIQSFYLFTIILLIVSQFSFAQVKDDQKRDNDSIRVKRFSIGAKIGIPNVIGGEAELVLPILNNHIAPYFDYSGFSLSVLDAEANLTFIEYGANLYLGSKGKGLYLGVGKASLKTAVTFQNLVFQEGFQSLIGEGEGALDISTMNLKLGLKSGGRIFFRFEVGYGMGTIPDAVNFTATLNGITETFSEDIPAIPGLGASGVLIGNIGFGIAF